MEFFDAKYYLERRYSDPEDKERGVQPFYMRSFHNFYKAYSGFWNSDNCKLLEFGGGPCVHPLISATPYVSDITFADFDQTSRDAVNAWKSGAEGAHNWYPYFEYVISKLENQEIEVVKKSLTRQNQLKSRLTKILPADIKKEEVFEGSLEKFDIVSSNLCFDSVANTLQEYKEFIRRIKSFVKDEGFLIGLVNLEETYWISFRERHRPHLYLTEEQVKEVYEGAGFYVVESVVFSIDEAARFKVNDCKKVQFIISKLK